MLGSVKSVLRAKEFSGEKANEWLSSIFEDILRHLAGLGLRFKYCCTGILTQNCGAGLLLTTASRHEKNGVDSFFGC
jgi:hypothetical protein